jgi:hypothetical protein
MKLKNIQLEKTETFPIRETISLQKTTNDWDNCRSYYRGNSSYWKVKRLVNGYIGRPFSELYWKVKPLLKTESKPMSELLRWHFSEDDDYYIDENGLIAFIVHKKNNYSPKKAKFFEFNNKFYLITPESDVGKVLHVRECKKHHSDKSVNTWIGYKFNDNLVKYSNFLVRFVKGHKDIHAYIGSITRLEADYFLHPEMFSNCKTIGEQIIDIEKCLCFVDKKSLGKYLRRQDLEKIKANSKAEREKEKIEIEKAQTLLGAAMSEFQLRKAEEISLRHIKEQKEMELSNQIRDRHGFDENSFIRQQNRVK